MWQLQQLRLPACLPTYRATVDQSLNHLEDPGPPNRPLTIHLLSKLGSDARRRQRDRMDDRPAQESNPGAGAERPCCPGAEASLRP